MTPPEQQSFDREHRRDTLLYFIVPLAAAIVTVVVSLVIVLLLQRRGQVSVIADWMAIVFVLCPALVCGFAICLLIVPLIVLLNRMHNSIQRRIEWLDLRSQSVTERAEVISETIRETIVNFASNFAFLDRILSFFDEPVEEENLEGNNAEDTTN